MRRWNQEPVLHRRERCSPEPKTGSFVEKTVKLRNRKPATSRRGCHHVLLILISEGEKSVDRSPLDNVN
ncbi:hypothetical protein Bca52824_080234 [Brassica carinata]|uniref:Uncharacterized protein n=1 Tax=Brassica carinata TaxID=52824 RepID=A0A8X7TZQ9_BRACI|nr:hypothetical protein Bca52824_080234 [Brassica carinata]